MENTTRRVKFRTIAAAAAMVLLSVGDCAAAGQAGATTPANVAPSFDCARATQQAEKLVCASPELSALDEELRRAYAGALEHILPDWKRDLVREQRNWVRYVRNTCADAGCLRSAYTTRIAVLVKNDARIPDDLQTCGAFGARECDGVVFYRDPTVEIRSFNKSIRENGQQGEIITCHRLIDLPVGLAHSNHSFGGYCTLQNGAAREPVIVCNDLMIGHFAMEPVGSAQQSDTKLVRFTDDHCFGG